MGAFTLASHITRSTVETEKSFDGMESTHRLVKRPSPHICHVFLAGTGRTNKATILRSTYLRICQLMGRILGALGLLNCRSTREPACCRAWQEKL